MWPKGFTVRFSPAELIDPSGQVVAREGDEINAGGAEMDPSTSTPWRCGPAGTHIWGAALRVYRG